MKSSDNGHESDAVRISANELLSGLKHIEIILQSLHRVGSFYADDPATCDKETIRVLDEFDCVQRLAKVRTMLLKAGRRWLTDSQVSSLEDALEKVHHWHPPETSG